MGFKREVAGVEHLHHAFGLSRWKAAAGRAASARRRDDRLAARPCATVPALQGGFDLLALAVAPQGQRVARVDPVMVPPGFGDKSLLGRVDRFQPLYPQTDLVLDMDGRVDDFMSIGAMSASVAAAGAGPAWTRR